MSSFQAASSFPLDLKLPSLTIATLLEAHHKNAAAWGSANLAVFDGLQTLAQRQGSLVAESVDVCTQATKGLLAAGSFEEKATKQADVTRDAYVSIVARFRELSDIVIDANAAAIGIVNARIIEAFGELRALFAPPIATTAAASDAPAAAPAEPTAAILEGVTYREVDPVEPAISPAEPDPEIVAAASPAAPEAAAPEAEPVAAPTPPPETAAPEPKVAAAPPPSPKTAAPPARTANPARAVTPKTPPARPPRRPTSRG
jgi:phasin family protein